ncbi:ABC transporter ATP-binding protein [Robbsia sp. Bb-Pol-6]|uniref:ABC transporter ATP-binding protein n=1 Tax=Robbsia betulipollinis TaxID=2981849 RepID=A0ABT3ZQ75_9BURK|nr:ABC transporter ATP-binding protein [Robbsia betulipollinis]MCY0388704.1 ABC transporter ATP-binding protein [Robbsia betulipollinis]
MPASAPVLQVSGFSLRFSKSDVGPALVDDVSFSVRRGETLCIVGESGCGKSVTSLALMGLLPRPAARITGGRAMFDGVDLFALRQRELADLRGNRLAMIFQEPMTSLNPAYTVGAQIAECVWRHRRAGQRISRRDARGEALTMLRRVGIPAADTRLDAYPHQLSGGMRQRVMIAMALANAPELLIADEPTTALDVTIQAQVLGLIRDIQRDTGTAMILITHDLGVVAEVADHVAVMYAGHIVESGPVATLFDDPQHPYTIGLMGAIPSLGKRRGPLASIRGAVPAPEQMPRGCRFAPRCPFADARCIVEIPPRRAFGLGHDAACWRAPIEQLAHAAA